MELLTSDHPAKISMIVTTYRTDAFYTQACLESIRRWKNAHHELIVVSHDESALLRSLLDAYYDERLIDRLVYAVPDHGHTRGYNLGVLYSTSDVIFNISNDILIGPSIIDHCAWELRNDSQLGLLGWHWYSEGTKWGEGKVTDFALRDPDHPTMGEHEERCIRSAPWFTGRLFESLNGPLWLQLCNTAFFGVRRATLEMIGGGFGKEFEHYWADDFLSYSILDQELDVRHFPPQFRSQAYFHEFQYDQMDVPDRRRHDDVVKCEGAYLSSIQLYSGGLTQEEAIYLHLLAKAVPDHSTVTNLGVWMGASAIILLDALQNKTITFHFIDCFDMPGISAYSGQPPATRDEFARNISPYIKPQHTVHVQTANTLDLDSLPTSDFFFVDAGHTAECIRHDARLVKKHLTTRGCAVFHDYGQESWADVKPELDDLFSPLDVHGTVAVYRKQSPTRERYKWPGSQFPR